MRVIKYELVVRLDSTLLWLNLNLNIQTYSLRNYRIRTWICCVRISII